VAESASESPGLEQRVLEIVAVKVNRTPQEIPLDASFESLGFESMDTFDILFALEDEFSVNIPDEKARAITSVRLLIECLEKELNP
jgi:acyl carrier protein